MREAGRNPAQIVALEAGNRGPNRQDFIEGDTCARNGDEDAPPDRHGSAAASSSKASIGRSIAGYVVVGLFLGLCGYYIHTHRGDFLFVAGASYAELFLAGLCVVLAFGVSAHQLGLFLKNFGILLKPGELLALTMAMCLGNMVTPMRGGTGGLAVYLKRCHSLDFHAFAIIYGGTGLLIALINSGLAAAGLAVLWAYYGFVHLPLSVAVGGLFGLCLYLSVFPPPIRWEGSGFLGVVFRTAHSWHVLTRDRRLLMTLTVSFLVVSFLLAASFYLIYASLGIEVSVSAIIITSSLGNIGNLVSLTPGSLGIFDAIVIEVPRVLGMDTPRAVAAALVFRVLSFGCAFVLGLPGLFYLFRLGRKP